MESKTRFAHRESGIFGNPKNTAEIQNRHKKATRKQGGFIFLILWIVFACVAYIDKYRIIQKLATNAKKQPQNQKFCQR
ncbi:hypothetical protein BKN38_09030 [Helicobacter sp. CLO-3]|nr:hypothetical protein BA723_08340 [Helicobacter sp. CLO-3]OHU81456.1 hypothetical protein BKN38_09030 [Helicobacter sp. CLO-3]